MVEPLSYDGPERRNAGRFGTSITIGVREKGRGQMSATLTSLSTCGGSVSGVTFSANAQLLWVRVPGLESLPARRSWSTTGAAGFTFENPLHASVAAQIAGETPDQPQTGLPVPERIANRPASRRDQILGGLAELPPGLLPIKRPREGTGRFGAMIRRTTPQRVEQRVEARYPPPGDAADGFVLEGQPVSLRDLSESGLQVDAELGGDIGREVRIDFDGFPSIAGTVVWTDRGATGLRLPKGSLNLFEVD